jgi:putative heme-binding domain-containing protein
MYLSIVVVAVAWMQTEGQRPAVIAAWPSGPLEVCIALDSPAAADWPQIIAGRSIKYFRGDGKEPVAELMVASAELEDQGRTLRLATEPHPGQGTYRLELPSGLASYDLHGAEASWWRGDDRDEERPAEWQGWVPSLDPASSLEGLKKSVPHERLLELFAEKGWLRLRSLLRIPEGEASLAVSGPEGIEGEIDFEALEFMKGASGLARASRAIESFGEPVELVLRLSTGGSRDAPRIEVGLGVGDQMPGPVAHDALSLPWTPPSLVESSEPPQLPAALLGGDPKAGEALFFGDRAKCSTCHRVGGRGEAIGPDLSKIASKYDVASLFREIEAPSTIIAPEYLPYTLATTDGRVASGLVRTDGAEALKVIGADGKPMRILRSEVAEIRSTATSIMPVGLVGVIGEAGLRDLMAYLLDRR